MFAYGQTGAGKTYTMMSVFRQSVNEMFIGMANPDMYQLLDLSLTVSFFEVYQGKLYDLFNNRFVVDVLEDNQGNVNLRGLSETEVNSTDVLLELLGKGQKERVSRATDVNDVSSRSHAILQVNLRKRK